MPKNRLGRGLNSISDIFLSSTTKTSNIGTPHEKPGKKDLGIIETHPSCDACINFISVCSEPTCKIFTFDFERYNVPYLAKIKPSDGCSCRFYKAEPQIRKDLEKNGPKGDTPLIQDSYHITRNIAVNKNIHAQKIIKHIVLDHLEQGYDINDFVMEKKERRFIDTTKEVKNTKVTISVKNNAAPQHYINNNTENADH